MSATFKAGDRVYVLDDARDADVRGKQGEIDGDGRFMGLLWVKPLDGGPGGYVHPREMLPVFKIEPHPATPRAPPVDPLASLRALLLEAATTGKTLKPSAVAAAVGMRFVTTTTLENIA